MAPPRDSEPGSSSSATRTGDDAVARVLARQDETLEWQEGVYRALHQHPELSDQEVHAAAIVAEAPRAASYEVHEAIERVVTGECMACGSPRAPEIEIYDQYPLTSNDPEVTARVAAACKDHSGERAFTIPRQAASEDFSRIPDAFRAPSWSPP